MSENVKYCITMIVVMSIVNYTIRLLPFLLFDKEEKMPKVVEYLGRMLPPAMMSVLLIYCIRSIRLLSGNHGIPELLGIATAMVLHGWKRNTLLSIALSTIVYMIFNRIL